uniref:Uncharacterized protein n=1 Tax=Anguilla anguilla TaxID=7936 RepID=A0A0E9UXR3_ANGAN
MNANLVYKIQFLWVVLSCVGGIRSVAREMGSEQKDCRFDSQVGHCRCTLEQGTSSELLP